MKNFRYKAYNNEGDIIEGKVQASTQANAMQILLRQQLTPVTISTEFWSSVVKTLNTELTSNELPIDEQARIFHQLGMLIKGNLPIDASLNSLISMERQKKTRSILEVIYKKIQQGVSLSDALRSTKKFDQVSIATLSSIEIQGNVADALLKLSISIKNRNERQKKLKSSITYPVFVLVVAVFVCILLYFVLLPNFIEVAHSLSGKQSVVDQLMLVKKAFEVIFMVLIIFISTLFTILLMTLISPSLRLKFSKRLMKIPYVNVIFAYLDFAKIFSTMATLTEAGISIDIALYEASKAPKRLAIKMALIKARQDVREGQSLPKSLSKLEIIPPVFLSLLFIGQQQGKMSEMLQLSSELAEELFFRKYKQTVAIAVPSLTIISALIVGIVVFIFASLMQSLTLSVI